jgi:ABC-type multidrug transport system fused ATPase/permease subunit
MPNADKTRDTRILRRILARYLVPYRGSVAVLGLFVVLDVIADLAMPWLVAAFIDGAVAGQPLIVLGQLAAGFLFATLFGQVAMAMSGYVATDLGMRATNKLRSDALLHVLALDMGWHNATTPGALIERIDGDAARLNTLLSNMLPQLLANALLLVGVLIAFFTIDWRAGLMAVACVPVTLWTIERLREPSTRLFNAEREHSSHLFGYIEERLAGTEDVRANGAVAHVMRGFYAHSRRWGSAFVRAHVIGSLNWIVPTFIYSVLLVLVLALGLGLFGSQVLTLGAIVALYRYADLLSRPLNRLGRQLMELLEASASAARLEALFALQPKVADAGAVALPDGPLTLDVDHVSFTYADGDEPVLRDVSFSAAPRRVLGLLGRTGSGKTTLTRLIARLYDAQTGAITLNGVAINRLRDSNLRRRVTLVTQDVQIFSASVRDNLTLFDRGIDDARIMAALDKVGMRDWVGTLPRGLDSELSGSGAASGGSGLSAGQAQLLAFARAFLREPGLVILDEASSRLDPATEQQLERAVDALLCDRTAIVIAHRLKTVERADDILVLENGCIVEYGPREALAADPASRYYALRNYGHEEVLA